MKKVTSLILFCSIGWCSYTQHLGAQLQATTSATAFPFLQYAPDAISGGMGDVGAAISTESNSFHWNTANLSFSDKKAGFSATYSPFYRQLVNSIHFSYLSGFTKFGSSSQHNIGGSIRYLANRNNFGYYGSNGTEQKVKTNDIELLSGYAIQLSDKVSVGMNLKFLYSDVTQSDYRDSTNIPKSMAGALDLSFGYRNTDMKLGDMNAVFSYGIVISNLGNKTFYTSYDNKDFLPANLRLGTAYGVKFSAKHQLTAAIDINKLLVPGGSVIQHETGALQGIAFSFSKADPGLKGQLRELTLGTGIEYQFKDFLTLRGGYFCEHMSKGNRRHLTMGAGFTYKSFQLNASYLKSISQNNPFANTIRCSLSYSIG